MCPLISNREGFIEEVIMFRKRRRGSLYKGLEELFCPTGVGIELLINDEA